MRLIIDIDEKDLDYPANILYAVKHGIPISDNATVCDIEQIRDEIAVLDDADYDYEGYYKAVTDAVKIIDKHISRKE